EEPRKRADPRVASLANSPSRSRRRRRQRGDAGGAPCRGPGMGRGLVRSWSRGRRMLDAARYAKFARASVQITRDGYVDQAMPNLAPRAMRSLVPPTMSNLVPLVHPWIDVTRAPLYGITFPKEATDDELVRFCQVREHWASVAKYRVAWVVDLTGLMQATA